jgi:stage V sporulation protein G
MEITEVRIKLMDDASDRLQAFCSITFDDSFVVRDLKIIDGTNGPFVAMPSRKLTSRCPQCGCKNHLRAGYCNHCGARLKEGRAVKDDSGRAKLYADIAHPINSACREMIQARIIAEFYDEIERSKQPGYVSQYEEFDAGEDYSHPVEADEANRESAARRETDAAHPMPQPPHHTAPAPVPPERKQSAEVRQTSQPKRTPTQKPGPHKPPKHQPPPPIPGVNRDNFGAGIF